MIVVATRFGQTDALTWWLESGEDIEYRFFDIEEALEDSVNAKESTTEWWERRGYRTGLSGSEWTKVRCLTTKRWTSR